MIKRLQNLEKLKSCLFQIKQFFDQKDKASGQ